MSSSFRRGELPPQPIANAIQKVVDDALKSKLPIKCGLEAQRLAEENPESGMTVAEIEDTLAEAAVAAGAPIELGKATASRRP